MHAVTGAIAGSVRIANVHVKGWRLCAGGVAPPTQEVGRAIVWWSGTDVTVYILRLCCKCLWTSVKFD